MTHPTLHARIKVWVTDDDGKTIFGAGRMRLLDAIERHGSILKAAEELAMSYRSAWGRIRATEQRLGQPIVEKIPGAGRRGGSRLTPLGQELLAKYRRLVDALTDASSDSFDRIFLVDE
jgi:molybdate transport system regulatory protein